MPQIINTNIASLNAQRNLNSSQAATNQALERLSSGLRINSAKDDAAGLAISTRFQSQINGLNVAIRNVGDGVSLSQTAEGALGAMTDSLQRIRELALQSANGTNSDADRQALNSETQQLIAEISRAGSQTNFNGLNLLDGSFKSVFQVGANSGETISVSIGKLTADTLGVSSKSGVTSTATTSALSGGDLVINGVTIGASRASDDTASTSNAAASAIAKAAAVNRSSAATGVTAIVDKNTAVGTAMTAAVTSGTVVINGTTIAIDTTGDATSSRAAVVSAINAQSSLTGVTAIDTGEDSQGVTLVAADGRNITTTLTGVTAASTGLKANGTDTGGFTLVASSGAREISVSGANLSNAGVAKGTYTAGVASVSSSARFADAQSAANYKAANDISGLAATNFGQLPTAGQTATITSNNVAAGSTLNFLGGPSSAAVTGNENLTATPAVYNFSSVIAAGAGEVRSGDQDLAAALPTLNFAAVEFTVDLGALSADIVLDQNYANAAAVVGAINTQLDAQFGAGKAAASVNGSGFLTFTDTAAAGTFTGSSFVFTAGSAGSLETLGLDNSSASVAAAASTNNNLSFDLVLDGAVGSPFTVNLTTDVTDNATLLTALGTALSGSGVTASIAAGTGLLTFTNTNSTGTSSSILLTNIVGDDAVAGAAALGLVTGSAFGEIGKNADFNISDGTNSGVITLTADYSLADAAAATALQTALNTQIGALNGGNGLNITATVTSTANELSVVFAETANTGSTITVSALGTPVAPRDGAAVFFGGTATNTGVAAFATAQNLQFTVADAAAVPNSVVINVNTNIANATALVAEINNQLTAGSVEAFASIDGDGKLNIVSDAKGATAGVTVSASNANAQSVLGMVVGPVTANGTDGLSGTDALSNGDLVINGVSIGAGRAADDTASYVGATSSIKEASGIAIAASINRASGSTGVTATVNATSVVGGAATVGTAGKTGSLTLNGIAVTLSVQASADANRSSAVSQINSVSGQTGVVAEDNGSGLTLTAADGRNIAMAFDTNGGAAAENFGLGGSNIAQADFAATSVTADDVAITTYSTVSLSSAGSIEVSSGTNGNAALSSLGLEQGSFGGGIAGQFLTEVDISTQSGANAALAAVDNALNAVNSARADLGAIQNRFETTISNLAVTSENLSAANSRILDADFAAEAAALSRAQILQQAGISILAQANAAPQQVLSLLQ